MNLPKNDWNDFFISKKDIIYSVLDKIKDDKYFPDISIIFKSCELCELKNTKVIIVGQDCYHGEGQANGLCFSVNENIKNPPSLRNILKEMSNDSIHRESSDFSNLAKQGVLFLNSSLTVIEKKPGSHLHHWEPFTDDLIKYISDKKDKAVFILWGNYAKKKKSLINIEKHVVLEGTHPSPLSANRGGFFHNYYFSEANKHLEEPIEWNK